MNNLNSTFPGFSKPIAFTVAFSTCSFVGCMIWEYETLGRRPKRLREQRGANIGRLERAATVLKKYLESSSMLESWRKKMRYHWREIYFLLKGTQIRGKKLNEGQGVTAGIIGCNLIVYLMWKIPRLGPFMSTYFCSGPFSKALCWPMALCCFSHFSIIHLFSNMSILCFCSPKIVHMLGREQFLAMYLSAGVFGIVASYINKVVIGNTSALSLGASGCVLGVIGFIYIHDPKPLWVFNVEVKMHLAYDIIGLILRRKCDHAAHLGSFVFGACYALWGKKYIWEKRGPFLRCWEKIRGPRQPGTINL